jgi:hypothetical protein
MTENYKIKMNKCRCGIILKSVDIFYTINGMNQNIPTKYCEKCHLQFAYSLDLQPSFDGPIIQGIYDKFSYNELPTR